MKTPPHELTTKLLAISDLVLGADGPPRIDDVAAAVGMSRASLYYWFSGQDDLVAFLLTNHAQEGAAAAAAAVDPDAPPPTKLRQMLTGMAHYLGAHPGTCSGLLRAMGDAGLSPVLEVNDSLVAAPLRDLLAECAHVDRLRVRDVHVAADVALGGLLLAVLGHVARGDDPTEDQFVDAVVDQVLTGLLDHS